MLDLAELRADTPGCARVLHFNNAGASLMPAPVFEALRRVLDDEIHLGGYEAERRAAADIEAFHTEFAALLNAAPDEIAWVENATRAWDMAFYGLDLGPGDRVITHASEYASNYLAFLQQSRRLGIEIDLAPSDATGQVDVAALESLIGPRTKLIAITHVPTQGGLVNPAAEIGAVAKKHGVLYLLDACQSVGQMEVDVQRLGCDLLSGAGRKFLRGPRGTGFLYVRKEVLERIEPPFIDLHAATWTEAQGYSLAPGARRFQNWESHVAGRVGLMEAVRYARNVGLAAIEARASGLAQTLRAALAQIDGVSLHDLGARKSAIVTFTRRGTDARAVAADLRDRGINVSVAPATAARLDFEARDLPPLLRASVHYFNTEDEIDRFVETVKTVG